VSLPPCRPHTCLPFVPYDSFPPLPLFYTRLPHSHTLSLPGCTGSEPGDDPGTAALFCTLGCGAAYPFPPCNFYSRTRASPLGARAARPTSERQQRVRAVRYASSRFPISVSHFYPSGSSHSRSEPLAHLASRDPTLQSFAVAHVTDNDPPKPDIVITSPAGEPQGLRRTVSLGSGSDLPTIFQSYKGAYKAPIEKRQRIFGQNTLPRRPIKSLLQLMWLELKKQGFSKFRAILHPFRHSNLMGYRFCCRFVPLYRSHSASFRLRHESPHRATPDRLDRGRHYHHRCPYRRWRRLPK
jgi:hypothetical protein